MKRRLWSRYFSGIVTLVVGLGLTLAGFLLTRRVEEAQRLSEFNRLATQRVAQLQRDIDARLSAVRALAAQMSAVKDPDSEYFETAALALLESFPGFRTLEWAPRVPRARREAFEQAMRASGRPDFAIRDLNQGVWTKAPDRDEYFPVKYSLSNNAQDLALGLDRQSEKSLLLARAQREVVGSRPNIPLAGDGNTMGAMLFAPALRSTNSSSGEQDALVGFVTASYHASELLARSQRGKNTSPMSVQMYDITEPDSRYVLIDDSLAQRGPFQSPSQEGRGEPSGGVFYTDIVVFAKRKLWVGFRPNEDYAIGSRWGSWAALCVGLALTMGLSRYLIVKAIETHWIGELVKERTAELSAANKALTEEVAHRREAQRELQTEKSYLQHLLTVHERDRQLTAFEIHDGLVQDATAALMMLEGMLARQEEKGQPAPDLQTAVDSLRNLIQEARRLMQGLRPPVLDDLGVVAAISCLIEEQPHDWGRFEFQHEVEFSRLNPLLESTIYRIVQESLANIVWHSKATRARVSLRQNGNRLLLEIQDWGVGFDPENVSGNGFGLQGIRKRAALFDAEVRIDSQPEAGTRIAIVFPVVDDSAGTEQAAADVRQTTADL